MAEAFQRSQRTKSRPDALVAQRPGRDGAGARCRSAASVRALTRHFLERFSITKRPRRLATRKARIMLIACRPGVAAVHGRNVPVAHLSPVSLATRTAPPSVRLPTGRR